MELGFIAPGPPIPPVEAHTRWLRAGPLSFGVEYRVLNDGVVSSTPGVEVIAGALTGFDSRGRTLHVCDAATGAEYLRFDCFDGDPHYHYITPGERNRVVVYDEASCGDMWEWCLRALGTRLPEMLRVAGVSRVADSVLERYHEVRGTLGTVAGMSVVPISEEEVLAEARSRGE
jgi:hypothetical protein